MTTKKALYASATPDLEISAEEVAELEQPFVVSVAGQIIALKGSGSFSLDDYTSVTGVIEEDPIKGIDLIAYDKASASTLKGVGHKILQKVLVAWFRTEGLTPGEPDSSES